MIIFKESKFIEKLDIENLYSDADWTNYTKDLDILILGIQNSLDVISVWDQERLIGLFRTIGDQHTIIYIQDLLILNEYKRNGIGKILIQKIVDKFPKVNHFVLCTDDQFESRSFYESQGFSSYDQGKIVAFGLKRNV